MYAYAYIHTFDLLLISGVLLDPQSSFTLVMKARGDS